MYDEDMEDELGGILEHLSVEKDRLEIVMAEADRVLGMGKLSAEAERALKSLEGIIRANVVEAEVVISTLNKLDNLSRDIIVSATQKLADELNVSGRRLRRQDLDYLTELINLSAKADEPIAKAEKKMASEQKKIAGDYVSQINAIRKKGPYVYKRPDIKRDGTIKFDTGLSATVQVKAGGKKYNFWAMTEQWGNRWWADKFNNYRDAVSAMVRSVYWKHTNVSSGSDIRSRHISHMISVRPINLRTKAVKGRGEVQISEDIVMEVTADTKEMQGMSDVPGVDWNIAAATQEFGGFIKPKAAKVLTIPNIKGTFGMGTALTKFSDHPRAGDFGNEARWIRAGDATSTSVPLLVRVKVSETSKSGSSPISDYGPHEQRTSKRAPAHMAIGQTSTGKPYAHRGPRLRSAWAKTEGAKKIDVLFFGVRSAQITPKRFWANTMREVTTNFDKMLKASVGEAVHRGPVYWKGYYGKY